MTDDAIKARIVDQAACVERADARARAIMADPRSTAEERASMAAWRRVFGKALATAATVHGIKWGGRRR